MNTLCGQNMVFLNVKLGGTVLPAGGGGLWCGSGGKFSGGWTIGLLLMENSMMHQGVMLLYID
jgi:hypothetical protein